MANPDNAPLQLENATRGTTIVSRARVAGFYFPRLRGLMGAAPLALHGYTLK